MNALELLKEIEGTCYKGGQPDYQSIVELIDANREIFRGNAYDLFTILSQQIDFLEGLEAKAKEVGVTIEPHRIPMPPDLRSIMSTDFYTREAQFKARMGFQATQLSEQPYEEMAQFQLAHLYFGARLHIFVRGIQRQKG